MQSSQRCMKAARSLAHIDCESRNWCQFAPRFTTKTRSWSALTETTIVMKFLILMCILAPICASNSILDSDGLLMQDLRDRISDSIRVRRQAPQRQPQQHQQQAEPLPQYRPYSQAPSQIKQLLQLQQAREPLVHIPAPPPPNFGPARPADPQLQTQSQAAGYRPQVQYGQAPQQPTYSSQAASAAAQYRPQSQQPQGQPRNNQQQYQPQGQQPQYNQGQQYQG